MLLPNICAAVPDADSSLSRVNMGIAGRDVGEQESLVVKVLFQNASLTVNI